MNPNSRDVRRAPQARYRAFAKMMVAGLVGVAGLDMVTSQTIEPPLVELASVPLQTDSGKAKGNLTLALSIDATSVGQMHTGPFSSTTVYPGYFDALACYTYGSDETPEEEYFRFSTSKTTIGAACPLNVEFDGNLMNWATASSLDLMRHGLTGGNRVVDLASQTILERAWLPDLVNEASLPGHAVFPVKALQAADFAGRLGISAPGQLFIYNCQNGVYFATEEDHGNGSGNSTCRQPFGNSNPMGNARLLKAARALSKFHLVRVKVCDSADAASRPMVFNAANNQWNGLCHRYGSNYKPIGQIQLHADSMRIGVFSYLPDLKDNPGNPAPDSAARYGGVMRAPLKYVGLKSYDASGKAETVRNAYAEWDETTGVFIANPQSGHPDYPDQGFGQSGLINYINRFGTLNPAGNGDYKLKDPVSELYYEALRYLQGKPPSSDAHRGLEVSANAHRLKENFPAYTSWQDPFRNFSDSSGAAQSCLKNSILVVGDVNTHSDRTLPGNTDTQKFNAARAVATDPVLDAVYWTHIVGAFESAESNSTEQRYRQNGAASSYARNGQGNPVHGWLKNAGTLETGSRGAIDPVGNSPGNLSAAGAHGGSYLIAGLAYWAHTQPFRVPASVSGGINALTKARLDTFVIDLDQYGETSGNPAYRRTRQLYLAAKYGGFDDIDGSGNPYSSDASNVNVRWQKENGDAKNYFLASGGTGFLSAIASIFSSAATPAVIPGGSAAFISPLSSTQSTAVYQTSFNPFARYWSGRLSKSPVELVNTHDVSAPTAVVSATASWEAASVLTTARTTPRNIVIGSPVGTDLPPTLFQWNSLQAAHQAALNQTPGSRESDNYGEQRVAYLRGSRTNERYTESGTPYFRPRDLILGDIINSGVVYMGAPKANFPDSGYTEFAAAQKGRPPVLFANANDAMLHAFSDADGSEVFAFVPGFVAPKMTLLTRPDYAHTAINDSTPEVGDAYVNGQWRSVLVSGAGGGGQGVYALDVTNPTDFGPAKVLWEFNDRHHPAMGNVIGSPHVVKLMATAATSSTAATYKWYAAVASGLNNYQNDGYAYAGGNPSIFLLDLSKGASQAWSEGTNFWRIELPQANSSAKGLKDFATVKNARTGAVDVLYAGDLQGNVWNLNLQQSAVHALSPRDGVANLATVNFVRGTQVPWFVAKEGEDKRQAITSQPVVSYAGSGRRFVSFGTGKMLESRDSLAPGSITNSFYTLLDRGDEAAFSRSELKAITLDSAAASLLASSFNYSSLKGWYFDFDRSMAEQQTTAISLALGKLVFSTSRTSSSTCAEMASRLYSVDVFTGNGSFTASDAGFTSAPLVMPLEASMPGRTNSTGQRTLTRRAWVWAPGSREPGVLSRDETVGRLSWRQINNFQQNKARQ
ncbi:MAG: PilC/PilY family type IV pilus protein [Pseudomonadota bacterium]